MTREEAIRELKQFSGTTRLRLSVNFWEALNRAIKALEQVSILDKIRAEIDELGVLKYSSGERIYKDEVLDIIDKYKAESEGEE